MADAAREVVGRPFTAFNFRVELDVPGLSSQLCAASFAECDGLEMSLSPQTIREGGNNSRQIHLTGPVGYGQLSLKRGMSDTFDLWRWFDLVMQTGQSGLRGSGVVVMLASDGSTVQMRFTITGCLPVKLKASALSAKDGAVAIEEMQIAYETLSFQ